MNLKSGLPFWLIKNGLASEYKTLDENIETEVLIIGSGITGALVAHFLCEEGVKCLIVDKRMESTGSTTASSAQLQYEIDVFLFDLIEKVGEENAVKAYELCLESISTLQKIIKKLKIEADFEIKSSLYLASDAKGVKDLEKEYEIRKKHKLPVTFLNQKQLKSKFNINKKAALYNDVSAQVDTYKLCQGILNHHKKHSGLVVYSHTDIIKIENKKDFIEAHTEKKNTIKAKRIVAAPGFESENILDEKVMQLNSTYVFVSKPLKDEDFWNERCLIWETARPYIYVRTTNDNRIMVGGFDEPFQDPKRRDRLMEKKNDLILKRFKKLFPESKIEVDFYWCGTFGETKDGLPFIGEHKDHPNMYFALGYGGNGITFSVIAAEMIKDMYLGKKTENIFSFDR
ncbi:glycine/D-amino acid oxidase-like deaminating enzyme [Flavobacterium arsenatis]|uniref:Glycine/D-amino acid oxidase-like deaminating enzyme n=1 Tax=Flavobacterium arsenatis TaxID=1484332 RepID=A0ABU1TPZ3_9FLAO|nr:FAD-dependent oxidoreductase [Flavobacterium arsenatis]MDR6968050.1 glycine/D-amino acid oxidase-like deaminating enzyme [Flavobacterium arsenatis]